MPDVGIDLPFWLGLGTHDYGGQPVDFSRVLNEIDSSITTYRWSAQAGSLEPVQVLPTLPPDFFGASTAAAIVATSDGRHVFASNRGQDGIAAFAAGHPSGYAVQRFGDGTTYLAGYSKSQGHSFSPGLGWTVMPEGAARAVILILSMLGSVAFYLWFVNRGRKVREVSVL